MSLFAFHASGCAHTGGSSHTPKGPVMAANSDLPRRAEQEATGQKLIVSTQGAAATQAALEIARQGGNLIDSAIAASLAISVERPHSTGLGGGGFLLFHEASSGKTYAVDFRERAPLRAREKMFLDEKGDVIPKRSLTGIHAVGTPGLVAGLGEIHRRFGKLPWKTLFEPAIRLAEEGLLVYPSLAKALEEEKEVLASFPSSRTIFLKSSGEPYREGERLVQKDLAKTLRALARDGARSFYRGPLARSIARESKSRGGELSLEDLRRYRVHWRAPIRGSYRGHEVVSMPPPSSGGVHLIEILNLVEPWELRTFGANSAEGTHRLAFAFQQAFADRARYLGDPDFVKVPAEVLASKSYADRPRTRFQSDRARKADEVSPGEIPGYESTETTHLSLMDDAGNAVATTQTINGYFGSGLVADGTGIVLNNEMDDFAAKPGAANLFGALGGKANAVEPLKTPLSSMSPTLVFRNGQPILSVGAPGGTRIITCVAQTVLNRIEMGMSLYDAVASVRIHHQWKPDVLKIDEPGLGAQTEARLRGFGYTLEKKRDAVPCRVMATAREDARLIGVSDPRDAGTAAGR